MHYNSCDIMQIEGVLASLAAIPACDRRNLSEFGQFDLGVRC
jgi:hypothetical protein